MGRIFRHVANSHSIFAEKSQPQPQQSSLPEDVSKSVEHPHANSLGQSHDEPDQGPAATSAQTHPKTKVAEKVAKAQRLKDLQEQRNKVDRVADLPKVNDDEAAHLPKEKDTKVATKVEEEEEQS